MSHHPEAQPPKSLLGFHRVLSPTAGVRVSPLCLGTMNFGEKWKGFMGECSKETSFEILDYFYDNGGNFIDTANCYQDDDSEKWIGEWMKKRGNRDEIVLATKYTSGFVFANRPDAIQSNYSGNNTKSLVHSVEASLKKLGTTYIDVLYLHWWDFTVSVEEVMKSLNTLCDQGKVLYLGISDTPAWIVTKANQYARDHGMRQFSVFQGRWSAANRDFDRDVIPMVESEKMGICPWGTLGGGAFKTEEQRKSQEGRQAPVSDTAIAVSKVLEKKAAEKGTIITSIALAYVMHKTPNVFPIIGGRKIEHLKGNIEALSVKLSPQDIEEIEAAAPFDPGFPLNFLFAGQSAPSLKTSDIWLSKISGTNIDVPERPRPIEPRSL